MWKIKCHDLFIVHRIETENQQSFWYKYLAITNLLNDTVIFDCMITIVM